MDKPIAAQKYSIKIEDEIEEFKRNCLTERRAQLPDMQNEMFTRIFPAAYVPEGKLIQAIDLCDRTIRKNLEGRNNEGGSTLLRHETTSVIRPDRPRRQGGDYRPHYPARNADAYMDALEAEIASMKVHPSSGLSAGDREKLEKVLSACTRINGPFNANLIREVLASSAPAETEDDDQKQEYGVFLICNERHPSTKERCHRETEHEGRHTGRNRGWYTKPLSAPVDQKEGE